MSLKRRERDIENDIDSLWDRIQQAVAAQDFEKASKLRAELDEARKHQDGRRNPDKIHAREEMCKKLFELVVQYMKYAEVSVGLNLDSVRNLGYPCEFEGPYALENFFVMRTGCFDVGGPVNDYSARAMSDLKSKLFELVADLPEE